jgi:hypothetical protein
VAAPVAVDTVIFIYFLEEHHRFLGLVEPLFRDVDEGRIELVTSALTLPEVLVVPYRNGDHQSPARTIRADSYAQPRSQIVCGPLHSLGVQLAHKPGFVTVNGGPDTQLHRIPDERSRSCCNTRHPHLAATTIGVISEPLHV